MDDRFLYFGYGSNLLTRRLQARTPSARVHGTGYVERRRLTFSKVSDDGSGKCDAALTGNAADRTEGVLFWIDRKEKKHLDKAEGLDKGYDEETLGVVMPQGVVQAVAYVASANATDAARRPYHWYKALVIAGAIEQALPAAAIDFLWAAASLRDPMRRRKTKLEAEAALQGTGAVWEWYRAEQGD
jgi:cation transport regulator ChaC